MAKIIYFENDGMKTDYCSGKVYHDFLDYAFSECDYFMLVYVNYYGNGYTRSMKEFRKELEPFRVKSRANPCWPGTLNTYSRGTTYKVVFYKTEHAAKSILKRVEKLSDWTRPSHPQDLAFFKGNLCWFYSVGHEKIGAIIRATSQDISFVENCGLATRSAIKHIPDDYFKDYDERIE